MKVSAMGDGFNGVYTARHFSDGWGFIKNDGTWLTTGIGIARCGDERVKIGVASPNTRSTPEEMIDAIKAARPHVKIVEVDDDND